MTNRIVVMAVFLVGCAVGGVSSQLVVPKASAQQAATLTKYDYTCGVVEWASADGFANMQATIKSYADQSWELTAVANGLVCFKRQRM